MGELTEALRLAREHYGLTDSDLALWLERPRQSVRWWRVKSSRPKLASVEREVLHRLSLLAYAGPMLPVPYALYQRERKGYLMKVLAYVRSVHDARVPSSDLAEHGAVLRHDDY